MMQNAPQMIDECTDPPNAEFGALSYGAAFLEALLEPSQPSARAVIERALQHGLAPDRIYLEVIAPALYDVGVRWERGEVSVAHEHLATATAQSLMVELAARLRRRPQSGRRAVVTAVDGDHHVVGARMVADLLEAQGWAVFFLGASTPADALRTLVAELRPTVVALSVTLPANMFAAAEAINALRTLDPTPTIAVGGWALETPTSRILCERADIATRDVDEFLRHVA